MPDTRAEYEKQRAQLIEELNQIASEPLRSRLSTMIRPAIAIETSLSTGELAPLESKFGGAPDVPLGLEWPRFKGEPLVFVAQLNLEELAPFDMEERLPKSGLLSFWTSWNVDFGSWRVFHFQSKEWQRAVFPEKASAGFLQTLWRRFTAGETPKFPPTPLQFRVWASHPWSCAEFYGEQRHLNNEQLNLALADTLFSSEHQIFGFPNNIQNDVRDDCAYFWNEFLDWPEAQELGLSPEHDQTEWNDWELLLQIGGDINAKMDWGDAGAIYFLMRRADLEARRFERAWFVFQCG